MIVKEILLNALANSGRIHDGDPAEAEDLTLALRLFNTEMKYYSGKNLVTAYQDIIDVSCEKERFTLGAIVPKKGVRLSVVDRLPDGNAARRGFVKGRDFWYEKESGKLWTLGVEGTLKFHNAQVEPSVIVGGPFIFNSEDDGYGSSGNAVDVKIGLDVERTFPGNEKSAEAGTRKILSEGLYYEVVQKNTGAWVEADIYEAVDFMPDVVCPDIERVVAVMYRNVYNQWESLRFSPLSKFYTDNDPLAYCSQNAGENKVKLMVDVDMIGKDIRIVYNSSMDFDKFDTLELPDAHIALIEIAVTVALLRHDADTDPTRLNNYKEQLDSIIGDIQATSSAERRIQRSTESTIERLHGGNFIMRRGV